MSLTRILRPLLVAGVSATALTAAGAAVAAQSGGIETVVVTAQKRSENIQSVPIAISAFSDKQLTDRQIAGGPDLVKEVPNLTFSKTNFTGYNIQIRGIGTQAVSVTTDPAVAVSLNDVPFLRNHFFEQEFFDVERVEVLRGPQGTLYGRNATAGVVNVISAKPTDRYEARASVGVGNYNSRRLEGMVNIPIIGDKLDLRVAGEWTKRDGYSYNQETHHAIDGRDLWSGRVSLRFHPIRDLTATFIWEHFQEDDNRARSAKQLCAKDEAPAVVDGPAGPQTPSDLNLGSAWLEQGCKPASLYSAKSFQTPNASAVPFIAALALLTPYATSGDPYAGDTQSRDLRTISSAIDPRYTAKNDTFEFNVSYNITPTLTLTSQTGYNEDQLYSTEDYNRFNTAPGFFNDPGFHTFVGQDGQFCDPQLGCSDRLISQDISEEHASQFYQELRLASNFKGPFNFLIGANYLNYHTRENYYVLSNAITLATEAFNSGFAGAPAPADAPHIPFDAAVANACNPQPADPANLGSTFLGLGCAYIDPNPLGHLDGQGHNYFRSQNPYRLNSEAIFGEVYYQLTDAVKLTGGLRYTQDKKTFENIPSWTLVAFKGYPLTSTIRQDWREWTGRANVNWTPKLDFTDQTLIYASYARGYKSGGANPPGVIPIVSYGISFSSPSNETHPATFKPEFNNAFEIGTKNTLLDGKLTLNADVFLYKYKNYQVSELVDRTAVNQNFNATVNGAEVEATWHAAPGLSLGFNGGYENATLDKGSSAIDLMDRTAGHPDWMVVKPFITATSNCILPRNVVNELLANYKLATACEYAYTWGFGGQPGLKDPVTYQPYVANPAGYPGYAGFDPTTAPNNGEGFAKDLSGKQLPNAPHYTVSFTADYTMPISDSWAATLHGDFYWQSQSFARVFNDRPYDKLHGYSNVNLALIFSDANGWQAMAYVKNLFDKTAISGAFLNSDDTGLTTNVFVTDPRLFGLRVTKTF